MIDLAHSFGRYVVAVGIEKAADALALVSMGCEYRQGFLLGQPMPEDRFISLLISARQPRVAAWTRRLPDRFGPKHPDRNQCVHASRRLKEKLSA